MDPWKSSSKKTVGISSPKSFNREKVSPVFFPSLTYSLATRNHSKLSLEGRQETVQSYDFLVSCEKILDRLIDLTSIAKNSVCSYQKAKLSVVSVYFWLRLLTWHAPNNEHVNTTLKLCWHGIAAVVKTGALKNKWDWLSSSICHKSIFKNFSSAIFVLFADAPSTTDSVNSVSLVKTVLCRV